MLLLFIRERYFEKKKNEYKSSAFSRKLVANLFSQNSGGIRGIRCLKNILMGTSMVWSFFGGYYLARS